MNTNTIILRPASIQDAELIADISRDTFYETFAEYNTAANMDIFMNEQFTRDSLVAEVAVQKNHFILAYAGDELAGYIKLREGEAPKQLQDFRTMEIARIYSVKDMIGKGVGKALMKAAIDIAKKKNKEVIWLAVWERNQRAIEFYRQWGFERFGRQVFVLGRDLQNDWMMKKDL